MLSIIFCLFYSFFNILHDCFDYFPLAIIASIISSITFGVGILIRQKYVTLGASAVNLLAQISFLHPYGLLSFEPFLNAAFISSIALFVICLLYIVPDFKHKTVLAKLWFIPAILIFEAEFSLGSLIFAIAYLMLCYKLEDHFTLKTPRASKHDTPTKDKVDIVATLNEFKREFDEGIITEEEYNSKKKKLLGI